MQSLAVSISNGTTTLENAINDQVYLKVTIDTRIRFKEKIDEKRTNY